LSILRRGIDAAHGQLRQFFVRLFLFLQSLAQEILDILAAHLLGPAGGTAIARDLVMLNFLGGHNDSGIEGLGSCVLFHDLLGFIEDAYSRQNHYSA